MNFNAQAQKVCEVITQSGKYCDRVTGCKKYCADKKPVTSPEIITDNSVKETVKMDFAIVPESLLKPKLTDTEDTEFEFTSLVPDLKFFRVRSNSFFDGLAYIINNDQYVNLTDRDSWTLNFKTVLVEMIDREAWLKENEEYATIITSLVTDDLKKKFSATQDVVKTMMSEKITLPEFHKFLPEIMGLVSNIKKQEVTESFDRAVAMVFEAYKQALVEDEFVLKMDDIKLLSQLMSMNILILKDKMVLNKADFNPALQTILMNVNWEPIIQLKDDKQVLIQSVGSDVVKKILSQA
jgi:hypothetical protein